MQMLGEKNVVRQTRRRSAYLDSTASQEEANLLGARVTTGQRHLDRHWHDADLQATVKGAHETDRIVVRINQGDSVTRLETAIRTTT